MMMRPPTNLWSSLHSRQVAATNTTTTAATTKEQPSQQEPPSSFSPTQNNNTTSRNESRFVRNVMMSSSSSSSFWTEEFYQQQESHDSSIGKRRRVIRMNEHNNHMVTQTTNTTYNQAARPQLPRQPQPPSPWSSSAFPDDQGGSDHFSKKKQHGNNYEEKKEDEILRTPQSKHQQSLQAQMTGSNDDDIINQAYSPRLITEEEEEEDVVFANYSPRIRPDNTNDDLNGHHHQQHKIHVTTVSSPNHQRNRLRLLESHADTAARTTTTTTVPHYGEDPSTTATAVPLSPDSPRGRLPDWHRYNRQESSKDEDYLEEDHDQEEEEEGDILARPTRISRVLSSSSSAASLSSSSSAASGSRDSQDVESINSVPREDDDDDEASTGDDTKKTNNVHDSKQPPSWNEFNSAALSPAADQWNDQPFISSSSHHNTTTTSYDSIHQHNSSFVFVSVSVVSSSSTTSMTAAAPPPPVTSSTPPLPPSYATTTTPTWERGDSSSGDFNAANPTPRESQQPLTPNTLPQPPQSQSARSEQLWRMQQQRRQAVVAAAVRRCQQLVQEQPPTPRSRATTARRIPLVATTPTRPPSSTSPWSHPTNTNNNTSSAQAKRAQGLPSSSPLSRRQSRPPASSAAAAMGASTWASSSTQVPKAAASGAPLYYSPSLEWNPKFELFDLNHDLGDWDHSFGANQQTPSRGVAAGAAAPRSSSRVVKVDLTQTTPPNTHHHPFTTTTTTTPVGGKRGAAATPQHQQEEDGLCIPRLLTPLGSPAVPPLPQHQVRKRQQRAPTGTTTTATLTPVSGSFSGTTPQVRQKMESPRSSSTNAMEQQQQQQQQQRVAEITSFFSPPPPTTTAAAPVPLPHLPELLPRLQKLEQEQQGQATRDRGRLSLPLDPPPIPTLGSSATEDEDMVQDNSSSTYWSTFRIRSDIELEVEEEEEELDQGHGPSNNHNEDTHCLLGTPARDSLDAKSTTSHRSAVLDAGSHSHTNSPVSSVTTTRFPRSGRWGGGDRNHSPITVSRSFSPIALTATSSASSASSNASHVYTASKYSPRYSPTPDQEKAPKPRSANNTPTRRRESKLGRSLSPRVFFQGRRNKSASPARQGHDDSLHLPPRGASGVDARVASSPFLQCEPIIGDDEIELICSSKSSTTMNRSSSRFSEKIERRLGGGGRNTSAAAAAALGSKPRSRSTRPPVSSRPGLRSYSPIPKSERRTPLSPLTSGSWDGYRATVVTKDTIAPARPVASTSNIPPRSNFPPLTEIFFGSTSTTATTTSDLPLVRSQRICSPIADMLFGPSEDAALRYTCKATSKDGVPPRSRSLSPAINDLLFGAMGNCPDHGTRAAVPTPKQQPAAETPKRPPAEAHVPPLQKTPASPLSRFFFYNSSSKSSLNSSKSTDEGPQQRNRTANTETHSRTSGVETRAPALSPTQKQQAAAKTAERQPAEPCMPPSEKTPAAPLSRFFFYNPTSQSSLDIPKSIEEGPQQPNRPQSETSSPKSAVVPKLKSPNERRNSQPGHAKFPSPPRSKSPLNDKRETTSPRSTSPPTGNYELSSPRSKSPLFARHRSRSSDNIVPLEQKVTSQDTNNSSLSIFLPAEKPLPVEAYKSSVFWTPKPISKLLPSETSPKQKEQGIQRKNSDERVEGENTTSYSSYWQLLSPGAATVTTAANSSDHQEINRYNQWSTRRSSSTQTNKNEIQEDVAPSKIFSFYSQGNNKTDHPASVIAPQKRSATTKKMKAPTDVKNSSKNKKRNSAKWTDDDDDDDNNNKESGTITYAASQVVFQMAEFVDRKLLPMTEGEYDGGSQASQDDYDDDYDDNYDDLEDNILLAIGELFFSGGD